MPRFRTPGTKVNENCGEKGPFSLLPQNLTAGVRGLGLANAEYAQLKAEVQGPPSAAEVEENGATNDEPHPRSLRGRLRIRKYGPEPNFASVARARPRVSGRSDRPTTAGGFTGGTVRRFLLFAPLGMDRCPPPASGRDGHSENYRARLARTCWGPVGRSSD